MEQACNPPGDAAGAMEVEAAVAAPGTSALEPGAPERPAEPAAAAAEPAVRGAGEPPAPPVQRDGAVLERLAKFEALLADHLGATAACSRAAFDRLYEEMQGYKKNFLLEAQRPLLQDLMMLYDSIEKLRRNYEQATAPDPRVLAQNLEGLQVEAEEILLRVGIERMTATADKLDVATQRAVQTVATANPDENLQVVERVKVGFLCAGQVLRKEQVVVRKYTPG